MTQLKPFVLFFALVLILSNCTTYKSNTSLLPNHANFNKAQSALISSDTEDKPMRVFLITSKEDSILLRTASSDIDNFNDPTITTFANRLLKTVQDPRNPGVGIAAPQVGILKNMIWVQRFDKPTEPFELYINPKITKYTDKKQFCLEGCLSIPERRDTTKDRAYAILMEYNKIDGSKHIEMIEAFTAVIFQHEIDHLNGILYTDHLDQEIKEAEERLRKN